MPKYSRGMRGRRGRKPADSRLIQTRSQEIMNRRNETADPYSTGLPNHKLNQNQITEASIPDFNIGEFDGNSMQQASFALMTQKFTQIFRGFVQGSMQCLEDEMNLIKSNMLNCLEGFEKAVVVAFQAWVQTAHQQKQNQSIQFTYPTPEVVENQARISGNNMDERSQEVIPKDQDFDETSKPKDSSESSDEKLVEIIEQEERSRMPSTRLKRIRKPMLPSPVKHAEPAKPVVEESNYLQMSQQIGEQEPTPDANQQNKVYKKRGRKPKSYYLMLQMNQQEAKAPEPVKQPHPILPQVYSQTKLVFNNQVRAPMHCPSITSKFRMINQSNSDQPLIQLAEQSFPECNGVFENDQSLQSTTTKKATGYTDKDEGNQNARLMDSNRQSTSNIREEDKQRQTEAGFQRPGQRLLGQQGLELDPIQFSFS